MHLKLRVLLPLLLMGLPGLRGAAQAGTAVLEVIGENAPSRRLTAMELAALPQTEVTVTAEDGTRTVFHGPTLRSLMTLAGAPTGHDLRGPSMMLAVVAEASDGYQVAFTLTELDEQFGNRTVILALRQDQQPLPDREGPFRVVVAGEVHHARWIRQVIRLRLVRIGRQASSPPG